jgi:hypothetical protein
MVRIEKSVKYLLMKKGMSYRGLNGLNQNGNPLYDIGVHELSVKFD